MLDARITLANIVDRVPNTYNINERWVVKKMKSEYVNRFVAILPIMYHKVQYFSNKSTMMISKAVHGELVNWAAIMYSQLVKELVKWEVLENMIEGTTKR
jgi:hypothetical protein